MEIYGGPYFPLTGGTLTGTLTGADGSTWSSSGITMASGKVIAVADGDATSCAIQRSAQAGTGFAFAASTVAIATGGTNRVIVDSSTVDVNLTLRAIGANTVAMATGTAIPAGGTAGLGYKFSSTSNFGVFFGSGLPTLSAAQGSLYVRSDGSSTSTRLYSNTDGGTTWTNFTSAA